MADKTGLVSAFVRAATLQARVANPARTPKEILEALIIGRFQAEVTAGRTIVSVDEAGGSVQFAIPDSLSAADVMSLADQAIQSMEGKRVRRLRGDFTFLMS